MRHLPARALATASATFLFATAGAAQSLFANEPDASFTQDQATRGQAAYARACLSCHGPALEGAQFGPPLKGAVFEGHWRDKSRAAFSERIRTTMPPGGTGALSSQGYTDVEAYILLANGRAPSMSAGPSASAPETRPAPATAPRNEVETSVATMMSPIWRAAEDPLYQATITTRKTKLSALTPVTDAMLANPPPSDWLMWRRTYDGTGYSPLRQIDKSNVRRLRTVWNWQLPESGNEITPLVHDGVMFIYSGPVVQALDAATGELLWQYLRKLPDEANNGRSARSKSLAIYGEKIFAATADGHMIALEARSGRLLWDQPVVPKDGRPAAARLQLNGGPIVAGGKVIIGVSLDVSTGGGCFIIGLDVESGKESWRFHTIARPGEPGGDTWNGAPLEERFGGGVWTAGSYDLELDLVYFGIANTYTSATLLEPRPGTTSVTANDGLYTDATVALRPDTGTLVWHYQHHKRDVWDLDWVFEQTVVTLQIEGRPKKVVVTGGKTAIFDAVDAATGAFVFSRDLGVQNVITAIDPITGDKTVNPAVLPEAGKSKLVCPGNFGARNWPATALNPQSKVLYVPIMETCSDYTYAPGAPAQIAKGGVDMRYTAHLPPGNDGKFGRIAALDLQRRQILWTHRQRVPFAGSALATAGGVLFNGDLDRYFAAYDQTNGKLLWRTRLAAPAESTPVTYSVNGRQYLAVVAGSGNMLSAAGRGLVPELTPPSPGITLVVFELP
jgi:alcohol dehydrogenase (cytochrome c)